MRLTRCEAPQRRVLAKRRRKRAQCAPTRPDAARRFAVLSDRNPLVISRQLLGLFAEKIGSLSPDVLKVRARRFPRREQVPRRAVYACAGGGICALRPGHALRPSHVR